MIQSGCCFFDGKTAIIFGKKFLTVLSTVKFFEKRNANLSFEKDLERNEKYRRFVFRKRKGFLFYVQPNGKNALYFLPKSYSGGKRHLFKRRQIG